MARAKTSAEGVLDLHLETGRPNSEVDVLISFDQISIVHPRKYNGPVDEKGWPIGYFEQVVGSMPELERPPQPPMQEREWDN